MTPPSAPQTDSRGWSRSVHHYPVLAVSGPYGGSTGWGEISRGRCTVWLDQNHPYPGDAKRPIGSALFLDSTDWVEN